MAIAANVAQAEGTRLDHILVTLGNLYRIFNSSNIDSSIRECVLRSLELRWSKADQEPFILCVFLNPYIRCQLFNPSSTDFCQTRLYDVVERVFERVFRKCADPGLLQAFTKYYGFEDQFSDLAWRLQHHKQNSEANVSLLSYYVAIGADTITKRVITSTWSHCGWLSSLPAIAQIPG